MGVHQKSGAAEIDIAGIWQVVPAILSSCYDDYNFISISGPHKFFITYGTPLLDTVNVIALDKICRYAHGQRVDTMIAEHGVTGLYGEGWRYNPGKDYIYADPLGLIRLRTGLCTDYANLLVYFYNAIGIPSNGITIFNGQEINGPLYYFMYYDTLRHNPYANIFSQYLRACDNQTECWDFTYHAVAYCTGNLCDASLGLFKKPSEYMAWWKYYLHPRQLHVNYSHAEPPPIPPYYFDHSLFIFPSVWPPGIIPESTGFQHSPSCP